jgi:hypothetical protein
MFFKLILDILNVSTKDARNINTFPVLDFKFSILPELLDFLSKLDFKLKLLISRVGNIFDIILESKQVSLQ